MSISLQNPEPWPLRSSEHILLRLLKIYPEKCHRGYTTMIQEAFLPLCRKVYTQYGLPGLIGVWLHLLWDMTIAAPLRQDIGVPSLVWVLAAALLVWLAAAPAKVFAWSDLGRVAPSYWRALQGLVRLPAWLSRVLVLLPALTVLLGFLVTLHDTGTCIPPCAGPPATIASPPAASQPSIPTQIVPAPTSIPIHVAPVVSAPEGSVPPAPSGLPAASAAPAQPYDLSEGQEKEPTERPSTPAPSQTTHATALPTAETVRDEQPTVQAADTPTPAVEPTLPPAVEPIATPASDPVVPAPARTPKPTVTPTNTPEPTNTPTNTPEPTATPTNTLEPTNTPTNTPQPTATATNTSEPTNTPTNTPQPTNTPTNTPEPTATPTNTLEPTNTPTNTPEPTETPEPTSTPEPTAAPTITPVATCVPDRINPVDVLLVIDRSGSMEGPKLADAKLAAKTIVSLMDLTQDQVGLVTFADGARLDQKLTHDRAAIEAAIDAITTGDGTDISKGVAKARGELTSGRRNSTARPVLILLTDGNSKDQPAREAGEQARAAGIRVITIGLGGDVQEELLRALASSPADYYFAPDSSALHAIYTTIAGVLHTCSNDVPLLPPVSAPISTPVP